MTAPRRRRRSREDLALVFATAEEPAGPTLTEDTARSRPCRLCMRPCVPGAAYCERPLCERLGRALDAACKP